MPPLADDPDAPSDALMALPTDTPDIEAAVNALPSVIRTPERRLLPQPVRTILVQRLDQLGDLVCSVPAIRRLRSIFPAARLIGLTTPANSPLATELALFDVVVTAAFPECEVEGRRVMPLAEQDRLRRMLAEFEIDVAIDLGEGDQSRAVLLLTGAKFLYGFKDRASPWLDAGLDFNGHDPVNGIEIMPPSRKISLLVEGLRMLAESQAIPLPNPSPPPPIALRSDGTARYAVLHAGARLAYTRWPGFIELAALLVAQTDLDVILFADDLSAVERAACTARFGDRVRLLVGQFPFAEFDALLSHCAVFVGNDSGPKHLAALRGVPVVSLHMARLNWSEWGQEGFGRIVSRRVPCAGCGIGLDGDDCGRDFACLRHIRPEEVFGAVMDILDQPR